MSTLKGGGTKIAPDHSAQHTLDSKEPQRNLTGSSQIGWNYLSTGKIGEDKSEHLINCALLGAYVKPRFS